MPITDPIFTTTALQYASDANYDVEGDAYDGSATAISPSLGEITQGLLRPDKQIPAQGMNWQIGQFALLLQAMISNDAAYETELASHDTELGLHEGRLTHLETHTPRIKVYPFTASGVFVVPARCLSLLAFGWGGGGGGAAGLPGASVANQIFPSGGGGGGSLASMQQVGPVTPGESLNVFVGAGGTGGLYDPAGSFGAVSNGGAPGADTQIKRGGTTLNTWTGAGGGFGAQLSLVTLDTTSTIVVGLPGGGPCRFGFGIQIGNIVQGICIDRTPGALFGTTVGSQSLVLALPPGSGGMGGTPLVSGSLQSNPGLANPVGGFAGGAAGSSGVTAVSHIGGPGGGGGGAGPGGPGGKGGNGVDHNGSYMVGGIFGGPNTGAGGGGSGSSGYCSMSALAGGPVGNLVGGDGGSGMLWIITVEDSP